MNNVYMNRLLLDNGMYKDCKKDILSRLTKEGDKDNFIPFRVVMSVRTEDGRILPLASPSSVEGAKVHCGAKAFYEEIEAVETECNLSEGYFYILSLLRNHIVSKHPFWVPHMLYTSLVMQGTLVEDDRATLIVNMVVKNEVSCMFESQDNVFLSIKDLTPFTEDDIWGKILLQRI